MTIPWAFVIFILPTLVYALAERAVRHFGEVAR